MEIKEVKIRVHSCPTKEIKEFENFQGTLKDIPTAQLEKLKESIKRNGFNSPIFIWKGRNSILDGHQRIKAIKSLIEDGWICKDLPYIEIEADNDKQAAEQVLTYNSQYGFIEKEGFDEFLTKFELDVEDLKLFTELDILTKYKDPFNAEEDDFEVPTESKYKVERGNVFQLGNHRLTCGDATSKEDVDKLMNGNKTDSVVIDPPYNVNYSEKNKFLNAIARGNHIQTHIQNDNIDNFKQFIIDVLKIIPYAEYNTIYLFTSGKEIANVIYAFKESGCYYSQDLKWVKNNHVLGRLDYNPKSENIIYGWNGKHKFYGGFQTDVIECDKPVKSELHPTMKPIELLSKLISQGTQVDMNVLDVFGGSGSTLIACEQLGRKCYMMELDAHYCSVIIERWEKYTGRVHRRI